MQMIQSEEKPMSHEPLHQDKAVRASRRARPEGWPRRPLALLLSALILAAVIAPSAANASRATIVQAARNANKLNSYAKGTYEHCVYVLAPLGSDNWNTKSRSDDEWDKLYKDFCDKKVAKGQISAPVNKSH
jgi:hypothetical protein